MRQRQREFTSKIHLYTCLAKCYVLLSKPMKLKHLLPVLLAGTCFADTESLKDVEYLTAPTEEAASAAAEEKMMANALNDFARAVASACTLMESVTDQASANAVAEKIRTRRELISENSFALGYIAAEKIEKALAAYSVTEERFSKALDTLEEKKFYGSLALAEACGYSAMDLMEKAEATPEIIAKIGQKLMADVQDKIYGISGGPGLTEETAWKMGNDSINLSYISTIMESLPDAKKVDEKLVHTEEGPVYGRFVYVMPFEGKVYELQMWFDITEIINAQNAEEGEEEEVDDEEEEYTEEVVVEEEPATEEEEESNVPEEQPIIINDAEQPQIEEWVEYTAEQKKEAVETIAAFYENLYLIACSVQDTASADAAAPMLQELVESMQSLMPALNQISQMDLIEKLEERNIAPMKIKEEFERIQDNDFYNSDKFKNMFMNM